MQRAELFELHADMAKQALKIMRARNSEYAKAEDPFLNFREQAHFMGVSTHRVILWYMVEGLVRLRNYVDQLEAGELAGPDGVLDKALDQVNFSILFTGCLYAEGLLARREKKDEGSASVAPQAASATSD